ncbi:hypothetical protein [Flavobacterium sp.]|uniref:hypothetical protein n=1 Tax=Flavobacterium sp. TaxID=239 RepID=UPI0038FC1FED
MTTQKLKNYRIGFFNQNDETVFVKIREVKNPADKKANFAERKFLNKEFKNVWKDMGVRLVNKQTLAKRKKEMLSDIKTNYKIKFKKIVFN